MIRGATNCDVLVKINVQLTATRRLVQGINLAPANLWRHHFIDYAIYHFRCHVSPRLFPVDQRLLRFDHHLTRETIRSVFHCDPNTGSDCEPLNVWFTVARMKFLRCLGGTYGSAHQNRAEDRWSHDESIGFQNLNSNHFECWKIVPERVTFSF